MKKALEFLKESGTFYLATTEGDQPRVRPFGAVLNMKKNYILLLTTRKIVLSKCYKTQRLKSLL